MSLWTTLFASAGFILFQIASDTERRTNALATNRRAPISDRRDAVGAYTHIGKRDYQEDRFVIDAAPAAQPTDAPVTRQLGLVVGVFDGHGGSRASHFASLQMASALRKAVVGRDQHGRLLDWKTASKLMLRALEAEFDAATRAKRNVYEGSTVLLAAVRRYDLAAVMHEEDEIGRHVDTNRMVSSTRMRTFAANKGAEADGEVTKKHKAADSPVDHLANREKTGANLPEIERGLSGLEVAVVNVGDSRCVLCRRELVNGLFDFALSVDHKPELDVERTRIEALGGQVVRRRGGDVWRVYDGVGRGGLAMSRAFGDSFYEDAVPSIPDVVIQPFSPFTDLGIVLATDGVWDVLDERAVCDVVRAAYRPAERDKDALATRTARKLVDEALAKGSTDNCTAVVVLVNSKGPNDK
jgi:serine/threonine protein phosphatase PrpC